MQELINLFKKWNGNEPTRIESIPGAGSNRKYVRFICPEGSEKASVIGVIGQSHHENDCFIYLSQHFRNKGLPVPEILDIADDKMRYLQTDLGGRSLYQAISKGRQNSKYNEEEINLIRRTIRLLPQLQVYGADGLDFERCQSPTRFDATAALFDLNYFKYCFLRATELSHDEMRLEHDMQRLAKDLAEGENKYFLYRDFQARNVMLNDDNQPNFIDYQGGRRGPLQYDVASYLWQASARYPQSLRHEMIEEYLDALEKLIPIHRKEFIERLQLFVLFRILQVLGAYGLRGYFEHKKYFLDSIPPAIENLRHSIKNGDAKNYPYLEEVLSHLCNLPQFNPSKDDDYPKSSVFDGKGPLTVRVFSFSFRKGIPEDTSGNGGGYVFDCRSTHNPGRYEKYKKMTGLDEQVINFLEDDEEITTFLSSVYKLADHHVKRYIERGFTDLMFSFGCTGGQHRSVYSAQHLAERLNKKYGIRVVLYHREQDIYQVFEARK